MQLPADPIPELKRRVAAEIVVLLQGWTQVNAGMLLHQRQPRVSELRAGRLERYSLDRLLRFLAQLNRDIEIVTRRGVRMGVIDHRRVPDRVQCVRPPGETESSATRRARMRGLADASASSKASADR